MGEGHKLVLLTVPGSAGELTGKGEFTGWCHSTPACGGGPPLP